MYKSRSAYIISTHLLLMVHNYIYIMCGVCCSGMCFRLNQLHVVVNYIYIMCGVCCSGMCFRLNQLHVVVQTKMVYLLRQAPVVSCSLPSLTASRQGDSTAGPGGSDGRQRQS